MIKVNTSKTATWVNADGASVPYGFVPAIDRKKETLAGMLHRKALAIEAALQNFHQIMNKAFDEVGEMIKEEYEIRYKKSRKTKGSLTWYNFDKSIKIEADVNEIVKWDEALMTEAKIQLDAFLTSNMGEAAELISGLVTSAFSNRKGMIDSSRVFQILRYQDKIKIKSFQKACELMKKAQDIDRTKLYMRIWEKQSDGSYRNINLNFSTL